jgi:hypothetical protein
VRGSLAGTTPAISGPDEGGDALPPYKAGCWLFTFNGPAKEGDMRVVTAFKRMLRLEGWASVTDVSFDHKGVIVTFRLPKRRRRVCSLCGQAGQHLEIVDYRHQDLAAPGWAPTAACSNASCGGCAARTAACATRPFAGPAPARRTPASSKT